MSDLKLESTAAVNIGVGKGLFMLSGRRCSERTTMAANPNQGKHFSRRRHTSFSGGESGFKRRKKDGGIVPPTKFLLGGNINDPLNLNSLADEVNQVTPQTSPMPTPKHRIQVQVLIPPNINDPLNLNADDDAELQLMSPKAPKRKHRKKKKHSSRHSTEPRPSAGATSVEEPPVPHVAEHLDSTTASVPSTTKDAHCSPPRTLKLDPGPPLPDGGPGTDDSGKPQSNRGGRRSDDKIVSPVIPQPGMVRKRGNSGMSLSESSDKSHKKGKGHVVAVASTSGQGPVSAKPRFREKDAKYRYGNYNRYYGYRNPCDNVDVRLQCFRREWFEGMDVLDIGCNVGHMTLTVASELAPRKIIGIDIDANLIHAAKKNIRHYLREKDTPQVSHYDFPISFTLCHGPIVAPVASVLAESHESNFPNNVFFVEGNYVLECDELLEMQKPAYDTILCLSLTKWVHLNWGDEGLKRLFKRMYKQLRPGGRMILEAQSLSSYGRKKKLTETIFHNYNTIRLLPDRFTEYLLSQEVGFTKCEVVDVPMNPSRGFRRPIQLFTKGSTSSQSPFQDSDFLSKQSARNTKTKYFSSFPKEQEKKEDVISKSCEEKQEKSSDLEGSVEENSKLKGRCKKGAKTRERKRRTSELDASVDDDSKLKEKRRKDVVDAEGNEGKRKDMESEKTTETERKADEKCKKVTTEHKRKKKPEENLKSPDTKRRKLAAEHKGKDFIACQTKKDRKDREEK